MQRSQRKIVLAQGRGGSEREKKTFFPSFFPDHEKPISKRMLAQGAPLPLSALHPEVLLPLQKQYIINHAQRD